MERSRIQSIDPVPTDSSLHTDRRDIGAALGCEHVSIVRYVLEPGERMSGAVHAHTEQEEVFLVLDGQLTLVTEDPSDPDRSRSTETIGPGGTVRIPPGTFQTTRNEGETSVTVLGLGAPPDTGELLLSRVPVLDNRQIHCPGCGRQSMRLESTDTLVCPDCETPTTAP